MRPGLHPEPGVSGRRGRWDGAQAGSARSMAPPKSVLLLAIASAGFGLMLSCSETTRHRVLCFFFDGVPPSGAPRIVPDEETPAPGETAASRAEALRSRGMIFHLHPPYRQNLCRDCHLPYSRQLLKKLEDGLCRTCHAELVETRYVHGPASVDACTFCHHHHRSLHPKMLQTEPSVLCYRCHLADDLTRGSHHETIESQLCFDCHDPHGGDDRFFLKRNES